MSELLQALYRGDRTRVDELLAKDPELSVFEAAALGRAERLRELLDEDEARANAFGDDGFHPLGLACFFGHLDAAKLLLEREADVNMLSRNEHVQTAAIHAAAASSEEGTDESTRYELVTSCSRLRWVAATTRTSTSIDAVPPTRSNERSWSTRSTFAWVSGAMSPISSRKIVPPFAAA